VLHPGGGNRGNVGGGAANRLSTGGNRANVGANRPSRGNRTTVAARPAGKSLGSSGSVRRTNVNAPSAATNSATTTSTSCSGPGTSTAATDSVAAATTTTAAEVLPAAIRFVALE